MDTLKELYKIGNGPSSSHTMGHREQQKDLKTKIQMQIALEQHFTEV